jgi:phosphinothricin acetyltransferase
MEIRFAKSDDLKDINDIYNHYVLNANCTFDTEPYQLADRHKWFSGYSDSGPYQLLVAVEQNQILGWACASKYRDHAAFARTAELTVYVGANHLKKGVGMALYSKLFELISKQKHFHTLVAGVALPNEPSVNLHKRLGLEEIGVFKDYAMKNGRYISSMWLQKVL